MNIPKFKVARRLAETVLLVAAIALILSLPLFAGTHSYPLTVVEGNSMNPTLLNGDLVYYSNSGHVSNGTIIIFTRDTSSNALLSNFGQPVIIHRVVGAIVGSDGAIYYKTKGDNNDFNDSGSVRFDQVLGTEALVIPKVGLVFLFLKSPQGLIAIVGLILVFYMSVYEAKVWKDKKNAVFMGQLAEKVLSGEVPEELYHKVAVATRNIEQIDPSKVDDKNGHALAVWLKNSLEKEFKIRSVHCNKCQNKTVIFEGQKLTMLVCVGQDGKGVGAIKYYPKKESSAFTCGYCHLPHV